MASPLGGALSPPATTPITFHNQSPTIALISMTRPLFSLPCSSLNSLLCFPLLRCSTPILPRKWKSPAVATQESPVLEGVSEREPVAVRIAPCTPANTLKREDNFALVMIRYWQYIVFPGLFIYGQKPKGANVNVKDFRCMNNNGCKTLELGTDNHHLIDKAHEVVHKRNFVSEICSGLKMTLLIGLLAFQGTQQAVAGTEFAGGMQPLTYIGDLGDISTGFASAFLLIFFSELGDKTFFIAALLAARSSGAVVFIGTFSALAAMSLVSVIIGRTFHYVDDILPFRFGETDLPIDDIAAVCLLVYFGVSTLLEASSSDEEINEEQKEAEIAVSEVSRNGAGITAAATTVISTFLLVFVAEWGDKSFFSTIALAAASSPLGVIGGALVGHALATLLAVVGGSLLGTFFSEKVIAYIGGSLFLVFALVTLIEIVS